jgi:hypothetical protein
VANNAIVNRTGLIAPGAVTILLNAADWVGNYLSLWSSYCRRSLNVAYSISARALPLDTDLQDQATHMVLHFLDVFDDRCQS